MNVSLQITKRGGFPAMKPNTWRICPSQLAKKRFGHLHFCQVNLKYLKRNMLKRNRFIYLCDTSQSQQIHANILMIFAINIPMKHTLYSILYTFLIFITRNVVFINKSNVLIKLYFIKYN